MVADAVIYHPAVDHYLKFVSTTGEQTDLLNCKVEVLTARSQGYSAEGTPRMYVPQCQRTFSGGPHQAGTGRSDRGCESGRARRTQPIADDARIV